VDPIRVFIADDHELVRYAMRTLLEGEPDIEVVGEAANGREVIERVCVANVDVLLLDLRMPEADGVEACRAVKEKCPGTKVLVLTSFDDDEDVFGVLAVGASGYLLKDTRPNRVVEAVRAISEGQAVFDSSVAARVISGHGTNEPDAGELLRDRLSDRELEVLRLMGKGFSNKEIARALWIGETTVKTHVSHILRKFEAADRTQAVLAAVKAGLLNLDGHSPS
jgi:DNA-binding NarL/FixJ family response regulator